MVCLVLFNNLKASEDPENPESFFLQVLKKFCEAQIKFLETCHGLEVRDVVKLDAQQEFSEYLVDSKSSRNEESWKNLLLLLTDGANGMLEDFVFLSENFCHIGYPEQVKSSVSARKDFFTVINFYNFLEELFKEGKLFVVLAPKNLSGFSEEFEFEFEQCDCALNPDAFSKFYGKFEFLDYFPFEQCDCALDPDQLLKFPKGFEFYGGFPFKKNDACLDPEKFSALFDCFQALTGVLFNLREEISMDVEDRVWDQLMTALGIDKSCHSKYSTLLRSDLFHKTILPNSIELYVQTSNLNH
jgi:hypothetical protein